MRCGSGLRREFAAAGCASACFASIFAAAPRTARAAVEEEIRIEAVAPARTDTALVCHLRTRGLPGEASRETLASGLPSALVLAVSLLDAGGDELGGSRAEVRIEPDLWDETWVVRTPLLDRRLTSLDEVAEMLRHLGPLPVLPLERFGMDERLRIRVRLAVHPLAPTEVRRVRSLFGGEPTEEASDRREVSVGLGSLVRYFLGGPPDQDWIADATSAPFTWHTLAEAP